jgi:hydroxymethylglutaryl-CoA reductase
MKASILEGFSKLSKDEKVRCLSSIINDSGFQQDVDSFSHPESQELFDSFSENTISNYLLPFGIAPNFVVNGKVYHVPMVVEESSVVAAASAAAKFWAARGGFRSEVVSAVKKGHVHFLWFGKKEVLTRNFESIKEQLVSDTSHITAGMRRRGGGILDIGLEDYTSSIKGYYRIAVDFNTVDSMGANFINSVLEGMAGSLRLFIASLTDNPDEFEIIMSILSNHVPDCIVESAVTCKVDELDKPGREAHSQTFVHKFKTAVDIACIDPFRAATHNKGIMNGIDAVVIATGNDFRAVEAGAHAYAALGGRYKSLSKVEVVNDTFTFALRMPMAIGTVGGLTTKHPMAKRAMQLLGNPGAKELMTIIASVGLASNFAAVRALVTKGIQQGHMKLHLSNMLLQYSLDKYQKTIVEDYFHDKEISYAAVRDFVNIQFPGSIK